MPDTFAQIFADAHPDAGIVLNAQGVVQYWNHGAQAVFGHAAADALQRPFADLVVPDSQLSEHQHRMADALACGTATFESMRRRQDGSLLYVDVSCRCVNGGAVPEPLLLLVEKDVTHIKVQRDARLMEARFRDLLDSTPDGIVMVNPTGHIVIANQQAESLFGYGAGELRGRSVDHLLPQRYRHAHVGHRSGYIAQPRKRAMGTGLQLQGLRKDGTEFPVEISLSALQTEESTFVMSAIRDTSERRNFEQALQEKNQELANANQAKDRFLASMRHELRTPLNAIIGFTGTLLMRLPGPLTEDQDRQLRTVQSSARHLLALINHLLDLAKIDAGKLAPQRAPVDVVALVEGVLGGLRPQAESKGLQLVLEPPVAIAPVQSDARLLRQILHKLIGNAVRFTHQGGVRVALVQHTGQDGLQHTDIRVSDTGQGIAAEVLPGLFAAFTRSERPPGSGEGTGLGLHLSQKLAGLLGGHITVDSAPGQGSCFTLALREEHAP